MQEAYLKNIRLVLTLDPVQIRVRRTPYPPHWKSGQRLPGKPRSLGHQIKKHRLEFHLLQADHIIPRAVVPELDNVIANLELMPLRMNERKNAKIGSRQKSLAKQFHAAALLSASGLKEVERR